MSDVTLLHTETEVEPECSVVFGAGRLQDDGRTDIRRVEIIFMGCWHARVGPHSDCEDIESIGYVIDSPAPALGLDAFDAFDLEIREWRATGVCPNSGFYVALRSAWLAGLREFFREDSRHYVVDGRDGYVELIARGFRWREWLWLDGDRESVPSKSSAVDEGEGAE